METIASLKPFDKIVLVRDINFISHTQKIILFIIATHLGNNDFCWLSISTLLKECCLTRRDAVTINISVLVSAGILLKSPPRKGYKSNQYSINFNQIQHYQSLIDNDPGVVDNLRELVTVGDYKHKRQSLRVTPLVTVSDQYQSPIVTRVVTYSDPKVNINKKEIKKKEGSQFLHTQEKLEEHDQFKCAPMPESLRNMIRGLSGKMKS